MPKISEERRTKVRERILSSAAKLVARRGVAATSMDRIVKESGLSKGAIYGHFGSKEGLLLALEERTLEERVKASDRESPALASSAERLRGLLRSVISEPTRVGRERTRLMLQLNASAAQTPSLRQRIGDRYERVHERFRDLLAAGVRSGEFRRDLDPEAASTALLALLDGVMVDWAFTASDRFEWDRLLPSIEAILFEGLLEPGIGTPAAQRIPRPPEGTRAHPLPRRRALP